MTVPIFPLWLLNELEAKGIPGVPVGGRFSRLSEKYYLKLEADGVVEKQNIGAADCVVTDRWRLTERGAEIWGDMVERIALQADGRRTQEPRTPG